MDTTTTAPTALHYALGTPRFVLPHLGTYETMSDATDVAMGYEYATGRTYFVHAVLDDGTTRPCYA